MVPHGDVVPRLRHVLASASEVWHTRVTQQMVARETGLDPDTIRSMYNQRTKYYDLHTLGILCWYVGFEDIGQLLARTPPPGQTFPQLLEVHLGRAKSPAEKPPAGVLLIQNSFAQKLAGASIADVTAVTGLSRNTVTALLEEHRQVKRISRYTLAAVCEYLDGREKRMVKIAEILAYCGPTPWKEDPQS